MENSKRNQVLEILDYWKIIEFLGQTDIRKESSENQKIIAKIKKGETVKAKKIEIFASLETPKVEIGEKMKSDSEAYPNFPSVGGEVSFCLGRIERNSIVAYLEKFMEHPDSSPEIAYPKNNAIACFSFQTDTEGIYLANSFRLSPILWAISIWEKFHTEQNHNFALHTEEYDSIIQTIDDRLIEKTVSEFFADLYAEVSKEFVAGRFPEMNEDTIGFFEYNRYINEDERCKDDDSVSYADLGKSFFLDDIIFLSELIASGKFGDNSAYEKAVISYILAGYEKTKGMGNIPRTVISPTENSENMRRFFEKILNVGNAPLGKWPAKFMPSLMQQVAVNIAIDQTSHTPIFSVNGPPGTGKTTLLKEIVASNIVDRALLLAQNGTDPDALFKKHCFIKGSLKSYSHAYFQYAPNYYSFKNDRLNDYGMLVASYNNAAVENITFDLPKGKDILENLESSADDDETVRKGLDEVHNLFDVEKSEDVETITVFKKEWKEKDIFFTRYANKLLSSNSCWGLVSAPFGNRSNIKKYCNAVLKPFIEEYKASATRELHKENYKKQRKLFLDQYKKVVKLRKELDQVCRASAAIPTHLLSLSDQGKYQALFRNYTTVDRKLAPIDADFLKNYASDDEKLATKAQVTNPWFTAQYNREREKLFLYACKLHKEFAASSKCLRHNIINLLIAWNMFDECGERMADADRKAAMPILLQSIFLITPVISTTFASAQTFLKDIKESGVLGTLIVDEAGQAQPQTAVGAMARCRKSIIVGDPKQIEPIVTAETDMIKQLLTSNILSSYKDKKISVQGFADYINPYGTYLGEGEEREWVGCPLVVHRRCIDPMYTISNLLSYDGTMKQQTGMPKAEQAATFILEKSCWIDVSGSENPGTKNHFVKAQGEVVLKLLKEKFRKEQGEIPKLFIITPFTSVKIGIIDMITKSIFYKNEPRVEKWLKAKRVGTVHTFQGQGTDEVIFLLGCDKNSTGAANWVNKNIVNVAATRAKFRFYLIGDKNVWTCKPVKMARELTDYIMTTDELDGILCQAKNTGENAAETDVTTLETANHTDTATLSITMPKYVNPSAWQKKLCPKCGKPLKKRNGKRGFFLGCSGYPECKYTENL